MRYSVIFSLLLSLVSTVIFAKDGLVIDNAWIPQAPPVAKVMAGYMQITNTSREVITIQSVSSPAFNSIEMHETVSKDGVANMVRQESITIPAGESRSFQRGGLHLMLFKPKKAFKPGDNIKIQLQTNHGVFNMTAEVRPAQLEDHSHHHHH